MHSPADADTPTHLCDATELARRIRQRELSARECLDVFLERIERLNGKLNAVAVLDAARARERAEQTDGALADGTLLGPLHGVPMTLKESYDVAGLPTTFGSPRYRDNVATRDSEVAARLKGAGVTLMGKTNVPAGLTDFQTYSEVHGTTHNPWDLERTPGGSSGGESAALAASLTPLGFGSDLGGSLRNPAHYTGVFAHKPTYGIVPSRGHSPVPRATPIDLASYGPMARSARDLSLALGVVAGARTDLPSAWQLSLPNGKKDPRDLRVVVWADDALCPVEPEIAERCRAVGRALGELGAEVSETARPDFDPQRAHACYRKLLPAAVALAQPDAAFDAQRRRACEFDPGDTSPAARAAWNAIMPRRTWLAADEERTQLRLRWKEFFERWDVLVCPIAPTAAFLHDHRPMPERTQLVAGVQQPYFQMLFWAGLATASYLPSTAIPTGLGESGLPIGVQLMGGEARDLLTIDVAAQLESLGHCFTPPPDFD